MGNNNRIAAAYCIYNEGKTIGKSLDSLMLGDLFDYAICVDGPYPHYNGWPDEQESMDGTREIIQCFPNTKLYTLAAPEYFKREFAAHIARSLGCSFLLIIDGDEYLINQDVDKFRNCLQKIVGSDRNIWPVEAQYKNTNMFWGLPRLWYKPWEIEYIKGSHCCFRNIYSSKYFRDGQDRQEWWKDNPMIQGITMKHDFSTRPIDRQEQWLKYQRETVQPFEESLWS